MRVSIARKRSKPDLMTVIRGSVTGDQVQWDPPNRQGDQTLLGIVAVPNTNLVVAVGDRGTVLYSTVTGNQVRWDPPNRQGDEQLNGIVAVPNRDLVVAVGARGTILRGIVSRDQVRWAPPTTPRGLKTLTHVSQFRDHLEGLQAISANTKSMVAIGEAGMVLRSEDGGFNWAPQIVHDQYSPRAVTSLRNHSIAVGSHGALVDLDRPTAVAAAEEYHLSSAADTLTVSWRYQPGAQVVCSSAYYDIIGTRELGRSVDASVKASLSKDGRTRIQFYVVSGKGLG